jgi:hypothetical protein
MRTFLLSLDRWDLVKDSSGGIAVASDPYSIAQDVASAVRTFLGECWFQVNLGVPYWQQVLGHAPPLSLLKSLIVAQAVRVPGCGNPVCFITSIIGRKVVGQIQFTDSNGTQQVVGF